MLELKIRDSHESKSLLESKLAKLKSELDKSNVSFKKFSTGSRLLEDILGGQRIASDHTRLGYHGNASTSTSIEVKPFLLNLQTVEVCFLKLKL